MTKATKGTVRANARVDPGEGTSNTYRYLQQLNRTYCWYPSPGSTRAFPRTVPFVALVMVLLLVVSFGTGCKGGAFSAFG